MLQNKQHEGKCTVEASADFASLSADVISAYVSNNSVPQAELPALIAMVHDALRSAANGKQEPAAEPLTPLMPIKKTITPDRLISLEDGKGYRTLKRHLRVRGLTPEQYRTKWGLSHDYPMVAPNYSKARSEMALALGLGQKRKGGKKRAKKAA
jgi:predicted transcriptional regulator